MRTYKEEITKICKYAVQDANAKGLDYAKAFIDPDNWEMTCFCFLYKKQYIVWNNVLFGTANANSSSAQLSKFLCLNYEYYDNFIGNTPEEALEKWVDDLFNGKESLSSVRLHIEIAGIS